MRLTNDEFKELKELQKKDKSKSLTEKDKARYAELFKKWKSQDDKNPKDSKIQFHPGNDFAWWNKEPSLMKDAANIASKYIAGSVIDQVKVPVRIPGVLLVKLRSTYGCERFATDPINVWARDFYLKFFQKYRGASGFGASDLGITIFAENEIVKLIAKYERIYGVINRYSRLNVNIPRAELAALGVTSSEADYLRNHMSDFRYDLNVLIRKAQRLCIPKDLSSIADSISLFGYEYMDHESVRSQIVVFDITSYLEYDETSLSSGGALFAKDCTNNLFVTDGSSNICKYLDSALNALLRSDSVQNILANMVVWFGENSMLEFGPIPEDYVVVPTKNDTMLHKLHNIDIVNVDGTVLSSITPALGMSEEDRNTIMGWGNIVVYQHNDVIITATSCSALDDTVYRTKDGFVYRMVDAPVDDKVICNDIPHILDTYRAELDPEVIVEGTLFKYAAKEVSDGTYSCVAFTSLPLYICTGLVLYTLNDNGTDAYYINNNYNEDSADAMEAASKLAVIDWAPLIFVNDGNGEEINDILGDIDNPVLLYNTELLRIHQAILYSAFKSDMTVTNK